MLHLGAEHQLAKVFPSCPEAAGLQDCQAVETYKRPGGSAFQFQLRYSMQVPKLEAEPSAESEPRSDRHSGRALTAATKIQVDHLAAAQT